MANKQPEKKFTEDELHQAVQTASYQSYKDGKVVGIRIGEKRAKDLADERICVERIRKEIAAAEKFFKVEAFLTAATRLPSGELYCAMVSLNDFKRLLGYYDTAISKVPESNE